MESDKAEALWLAITQIEAQEQLKKMTIADWPKLGRKDRTKIHKELFNQAYPNLKQKKNFITPEQMQKVLGR